MYIGWKQVILCRIRKECGMCVYIIHVSVSVFVFVSLENPSTRISTVTVHDT